MLSGSPPNNQYKEAIQVLFAVANDNMNFQLPENTTSCMRNLVVYLLKKLSRDRPSAQEALGNAALT